MDHVNLGSEDADGLVDSLNILLDNLDIPLVLESPYDLTPSLLLAILESTLKSRLPLSDKLRQAHSPQSKVEAVKVFLGVLGNDVLKIDLSNVDPRRLARGEWEEVVYVGILLVRVAKGVGMLEADNINIIDLEPDATSSQIDSEEHPGSPISPPVSLTPSPPPVRAPRNKPGRPSLSLSPPLHSAVKTPRSKGRRDPRPPERESTPPSSTRKPSYMTYRPLASPPNLTLTRPAEISICSCTFEEDLTASTVHCHCEIHGSDTGQSDPDTSVDDYRISWNKGSLPVNILALISIGNHAKAKGRDSVQFFKSNIDENIGVEYSDYGTHFAHIWLASSFTMSTLVCFCRPLEPRVSELYK